MGQPPTFMYTLFACRRRHTDTNRKLLRTKLLPLSPCIHNPSGLPLPSFHAYQHKTNRGGGCQIFTAIPICFYTPLTVQHPAFSYLQLISSMTQGSATTRSRACMPYSTHNPECGRETTHGWIYDNACFWPSLPGKKQAYGNAWLIRFPMMLSLDPKERYLRRSGYRRNRVVSAYHPCHRRSGYRRNRVFSAYHPYQPPHPHPGNP